LSKRVSDGAGESDGTGAVDIGESGEREGATGGSNLRGEEREGAGVLDVVVGAVSREGVSVGKDRSAGVTDVASGGGEGIEAGGESAIAGESTGAIGIESNGTGGGGASRDVVRESDGAVIGVGDERDRATGSCSTESDVATDGESIAGGNVEGSSDGRGNGTGVGRAERINVKSLRTESNGIAGVGEVTTGVEDEVILTSAASGGDVDITGGGEVTQIASTAEGQSTSGDVTERGRGYI